MLFVGNVVANTLSTNLLNGSPTVNLRSAKLILFRAFFPPPPIDDIVPLLFKLVVLSRLESRDRRSLRSMEEEKEKLDEEREEMESWWEERELVSEWESMGLR